MRLPPSTLAKVAAACVLATALVLAYATLAVLHQVIPPVLVMGVAALLFGAGALVRRRWSPALAATYGLLFLVLNAPFMKYELTRIDSPMFGVLVVAAALNVLALVAGVGAVVQNYRVAPEARRQPRWLVPGASALVGACLAAVAIAALPRPGAAADVSPEAMDALPAIELKNFEFTEKEIRVKAGEQVALRVVNRDAMPHSFDVDELNVHAPIPANGVGLALFRAGAPGRYVVYCAPHYDRASGQGMKATLIVE